ncbi:MAG: putative Co/Zn/Cd efflux system rane fusion protein [Myxococcales bacterium]|nr:putative Co/Zn/Cd efflux system rane fusion protein [Myxococcales bacterium]
MSTEPLHAEPVATAAKTAPPPHRRSTGAWIVAAVSILALGGWFAVRLQAAMKKQSQLATERADVAKAAEKAPAASSAAPKLVAPSLETWQPEVQFEGTLQPVREADLGFKVAGRLAQIRVRLGDRVSTGQVLATLDATEAEAQVQAAQAQVRAAEAQLALADDSAKRTSTLVGSGAASAQVGVQTGQQRSLAAAQLDSARAQLQLAQASLHNHVIAAPFGGSVTRVPPGAGAIINPGTVLFHVQDTSVVKLSGAIGEADAALVKPGAPLEVRLDGRRVQGKVATILTSVDASTRRVPLEAEIKNDSGVPLRGGVFVHAAVTGLAPVQVLRLPATALRPGSQNEVMVVEGARVHARHVLFVRAADGSILVRSGLEPKEKVILAPTAEAQDGDSFVVTQ